MLNANASKKLSPAAINLLASIAGIRAMRTTKHSVAQRAMDTLLSRQLIECVNLGYGLTAAGRAALEAAA